MTRREVGIRPPRLAAVDLRGDVDLDVRWLGFLTQRQPDRQDAGVVLGGYLAGIDRRWQRERPGERAKTALDAMKLLLRDIRVELPLAPDRERVAFNGHLDLVLFHIR